MAISRKGNVGNEHAPASSPAVAHRRAKRTEWRMRGIRPNKNITSFSPHPSCLRNASAIHLPPRGGRLNRLRTLLSFRGVSNAVVAITRIKPKRTPMSFRPKRRNPLQKKRHAAYPRQPNACGGSPPRNSLREKRNQTYTITPKHSPAVARHREIPYGRNDNKRTRLSRILASSGSLPRQPTIPQWLTALARGFGRTPLAHDNKNYLKKCRNRSIYV